MIPKIVHYCWFGNNEKSAQVKEYIREWKRKLPDYTFMEWNEETFDIHRNNFVNQAYNEKKYAFVSDVARLYALFLYGGVYMDTDVLLKKRPDSIFTKNDSLVLGFENGGKQISTAFIAAEKNNQHVKKLLEYYSDKDFVLKKDGKNQYNNKPNTYIFAEYFSKLGFILDNNYQEIKKIRIFPEEYFSAYDFRFFEIIETSNTVSIHNFKGSWSTKNKKLRKYIKQRLIKIFGKKNYKKIYFLLKGKNK